MFRFNTFKFAVLMSAMVMASGCGVKKTTAAINPSYSRAPTCDDAIQVYASRSEVPYDYYEVAWISAQGSSVYTSDGKLRSEVIKGAAKAGANGAIINPEKESKATVKVLGETLGMKSSTTKVSALAIYMPADSGRVTLKCGHG
jgi:hypothetical protein